MTKKFLVAAGLIALLAFLIPIEHKYDKLFRFFSLTLIPDDLTLSPHFEKKIYFFVTDLIALALLFLGFKNRRFFTHPLWIVPLCALLSILTSPFIHYPLPYIRLLQLITPITLFSFLATGFTPEERSKVTKWVLLALFFAGLFQSGVGIAQYFKQGPLGLRILGEVRNFSTIEVQGGARFLFDSSPGVSELLIRATGTMQHANVFGGFLTLTLLSTYALLLLIPKYRALFILSIPVQFFALTLSYSRSALFAWAIGTAIWLGLLIYKMGIKNRLIQRIVIILGVTFLASGSLLYNQYSQRGGVVSTTQLNQSSDKIRTFHQGLALQILKDHPLTGLGYGQFSERASDYFPQNTDDYVRSTAPHNIYLFLACETGIISLGAFLLTIALLLWSVTRSSLTVEIITCTSLLFAFLFIGLCDFYLILFQPGKLMFFLIAGLLAAHTGLLVPKAQVAKQLAR
jgi:O-antigen ligase